MANFSVFYASCKIDWSEFFSSAHKKKIMTFEYNLQKFH